VTRPRVLLDVDGVLADFLTPCIQIINEMTGWDKKKADIKSWHVFKSLGVPEDVETRVYAEMQRPGWCLSLDPLPGAVEGVARLRQTSEVYFVTSPMKSPNWTHERTLWLIEHFGADWKSVIHCSAKHVCAGDVFVDDRVEHLVRWKKSHPHGVAIKYEAEHNIVDDWEDGITVRSWREFPSIHHLGGRRSWLP